MKEIERQYSREREGALDWHGNQNPKDIWPFWEIGQGRIETGRVEAASA